MGLWDAPVKGKTILKAGIILLGVLVATVCALWSLALFAGKPPKEKKLIENFYGHRAYYERLRDMLLADQQVEAVYVAAGVLTTKSGLPHKPSEVNFPATRYNEYVALLEKVGSNAAFRTQGNEPELVCIGAWSTGWAGNTRHVWVCSTDREIKNRVDNLDDYYRDPQRPHDVFRHIDGNWYLRADW